ncbi:hypothetical protein [Desulfosporosinus sp. BG]|nr:hypothetical protein [Desulfosporosinus sp. BG]ODA40018.1 hypothetical protein DSBG_3224 [Desulfosporosinus sp. BG]
MYEDEGYSLPCEVLHLPGYCYQGVRYYHAWARDIAADRGFALKAG